MKESEGFGHKVIRLVVASIYEDGTEREKQRRQKEETEV
jgi:hypothetical protein